MHNGETTLLSAAWRYRWLVIVVTAAFVALGLTIQLLRPQEVTYEATSTVILQEQVTSVEADSQGGSSTAFIRSQLEIMQSPVVAEAAAELAIESGFEADGETISEAVSIVGSEDSPLVSVTAQASSPEAAVAYSNALAEGYRRVSQQQATARSEGQLARIDAQVESIDERLREIEDELATIRSNDPALEDLRQQARESVGEIAALQDDLFATAGDEAAVIRQDIEDHIRQIQIYAEVTQNSSVSPEQQALVEEQLRQVERRANLLTLRDEVAVDVGLVPDAVALVQSASVAERLESLGMIRTLAVSLILGLAAGITLAYLQSTWRRTFAARAEPEAVLGAPMLADVPEFEAEHLDSKVPVRDHPRSVAAEAYRFAAASTESGARGRDINSIFVVSSTLGHGKSTTVVNTAIASAIHGRSVLVVDCDFGSQEASRLLLGEHYARLTGVTDIVEGSTSIQAAAHRVDLGDDVSLQVMPRGTRPGMASSVLQSEPARRLFADLVDEFALIFIDGPPLLQVAYASTLAQLAQGVVVVVEHESLQSELVDLTDRLNLLGSPVLGYVYNRSPLRREMTLTEGSMMDILGDASLVSEPPRSSRRG